MNLPNQRWHIAPSNKEKINQLVENTALYPLIAQVLLNRGIDTSDRAQIFLNPETENLPSPLQEFRDLAKSVDLLKQAIAAGEKIAICGDYDADGMTSTALLLRALGHLGANVDYAIPSRMKEGYGINCRIIEDFSKDGVKLVLTVDNGISAFDPIKLAVELGITVIITDHHDLPEILPPADAILNPKLLAPTSPYRGLAGVGVAYILAVSTAQQLNQLSGLTEQLLELYTLGTIADLAPLTGVNRRWLKRGLRRLPKSQLTGVQALMQVAGVNEQQKKLQPDDIGFRLGPRINAIGRIGDPQVVIELLSTDNSELALERATQCEQTNTQRRELCEQIEAEAIQQIESEPIDWQGNRVLVVVQPGWHHGVIGIVASRLVERYGVPTFIATYEDQPEQLRGSARGIEEFDVFQALEFCGDLLEKYGGHKAAGGFSLLTQNLQALKQRLQKFAHQSLALEHLRPLIKIDAQAQLSQLNSELYQQIDSLQPWGIGNDYPVFWTENVRVIQQRVVGNNHLKLGLSATDGQGGIYAAIAWRWGEYFPLPTRLDIAYKLQENHWNGQRNIQLEILGARIVQKSMSVKKGVFTHKSRIYTCSFADSRRELRIRNDQGQVLAIKPSASIGLLGISRETAQEVDIRQPHYALLIKAAKATLEKGSD